MKKTTVTALLLILLLSLSACSYLFKPDDEVIRKAVTDLLPDAYTATYLIFGPGIELDPESEIDPEWKTAHYIPVARDYAFQTEDDVRAVTLRAFSHDYAEEMFEYAFVNNDLFMSRYTEYGGRLAMDVVTKQPLSMAKEFFPETLRVTGGNSYACKAEIECTLGNGERSVITLQLVFENDRWVFDGPVF